MSSTVTVLYSFHHRVDAFYQVKWTGLATSPDGNKPFSQILATNPLGEEVLLNLLRSIDLPAFCHSRLVAKQFP